MLSTDFILGIIGFILTLSILSYIVAGDNPVFRTAAYLFVGVAAGYVTLMIVEQVLYPRVLEPLVFGTLNGVVLSMQERILALVPLLLGILMLTKLSPDTARLGNVPMAFLVGVSAAVTIGGATVGTMVSQVVASIQLVPKITELFSLDGILSLGYALLVIVGLLGTVFYFYFGSQQRVRQATQTVTRGALVEGLAKVGQVFIAIAFGAIFSGVYVAAISALVDRVHFLLSFIPF